MKKGALVAITLLLIATNTIQSHAVAFGETLNGKTISVKINSIFELKLNSTYWQLNKIKNNDLISQVGQESVTLIKPGPTAPTGCQHPGSGCGTISWKIKALRIGTTKISAFRSSCGEALKCTAKEQNFLINIKIIK